MNAVAEELNRVIEQNAPHAFEMLSNLGKNFYFPSGGILGQSAEAAKKAHKYNATIGTAYENGKAMHLNAVMSQLPGFSPNDALLYAPSFGNMKLRQAWQAKDLQDNPDLQGKPCSLPVVTCGLSHALSLLADLLTDPGDPFVFPDKNWGNYKLNFIERKGAVAHTYPLFANGQFNVQGLKETLMQLHNQGKAKAIVLLNFPNNPTGYTPTDQENEAIAAALTEVADTGMNLAVIVDDAYYGLFFESTVARQSLFTKLAGRHSRIFAFKADAATKEVYVWGLRVVFVPASIGGVEPGNPMFDALNQKLGGIVRAVISNDSQLSQFVVLKALENPDFFNQRQAKADIMKGRYDAVKAALANPEYAEAWTPYPFNSGYFMCLQINKIEATALRKHLLDAYGVGTIAVSKTDLRIAFSCLEKEGINELFALIYQGWKDLAK